MKYEHVGILGTGIYLPEGRMTAREISAASGGQWTENAVIEKLGIRQKPLPGTEDGTQEMGVKAAKDCLERTALDPLAIDLILSIGEEWKEYPLTTSGIYIQEAIGAKRAWAIDLQQRCCSCVAAMKIAKDMMRADEDLNCVLIVGGYRNGDFVDYQDPEMSMMYNLGAGGGALILQKNLGRNLLLGSHIMTDGSMARDVGVRYGGTCYPIDQSNLDEAYTSLKLFDGKHMKDRLGEVSLPNWFLCIDRAFEKSSHEEPGVTKSKLDYLAVLHFKHSMHLAMLEHLGLKENQSTYLSDYGHLGQIDQILSLQLGLEQGKVTEGSVVSMIAAGIGYAWAANVIQWGKGGAK